MKLNRPLCKVIGSFLVTIATAIGVIVGACELFGFKPVYEKWIWHINVLVVLFACISSLVALKVSETPEPEIIYDLNPSFRLATEKDVKVIHRIALDRFKDENLLFPMKVLKNLVKRAMFIVADAENAETGEVTVVAYYAILPMTKKVYKSLRDHVLSEANLTSDHVLDPKDPACEVLYVLDVAQRINHNLCHVLVSNVARSVAKMCQDNSNINLVCAWAYGDQGKQLIKIFGMNEVVEVRGFNDASFLCETKVSDLATRKNTAKYWNSASSQEIDL